MRQTKRILSFLLALTVTLSSFSETITAEAEYFAENRAEASAADNSGEPVPSAGELFFDKYAVKGDIALDPDRLLPVSKQKRPDSGDADELPVSNGETVASGTCGDSVTWTLDDLGTLTISGTGDMRSYDSSSNTAPWRDQTGVKAVKIENGVTCIGAYAFYGMTSVESADIADSVSNIGSAAFYGCTSLASVDMSDSITRINSTAFRNCTSLKSITLPDSLTVLSGSTFMGCTSLTDVTIPNSLTKLEGSIFCDCTSLKSITIPNNITSLGSSLFKGCTGLTSITIPNSVTSPWGDLLFTAVPGLKAWLCRRI